MRWCLLAGVVVASGCAGTAANSCRDVTEWSSNTVSIDIDAPLDEVYAFVVAEDAPGKVLRRYGPVPAPKESRIIDGPWERVGARRVVTLDNGGTLEEQITAYDRPALYAYRISDFHFFVKGFSASGAGVWQFFRTDAGKTRVVWTYTFEPKSRGRRPLLDVGVSWFYRPYMRRGLEETKQQLERQHRATAHE
jgi:hypothetical protein